MGNLWPLSVLFSLFSHNSVPHEKTSLSKVMQKRIREDITFLTTTSAPRHYRERKALKEATDYIQKEFATTTDRVEILPFKIKSGEEYENIVASFGPENAPRFIIGAHYDVAGYQPGADDNASGVAAILEIARLLKKDNPKLRHRIDLVALALEEPPFFASSDMGSAHYARALANDKVEVKMMLALDMIGYFSEEKGSQERPFPLQAIYPDTGDFIGVVGNLGQVKGTQRVKKLMLEGGDGLKVEAVNAPASIPGVDFSDHRNFWEEGYPGLMITDTAFYRNPNYHGQSDTIETLDFTNMARVIQGLYYTAVNF